MKRIQDFYGDAKGMGKSFRLVDGAVRKAVFELVRNNEEIKFAHSRINGQPVPSHVFAAATELVKFMAGLSDRRGAPGARSRIMLRVGGRDKDFSVAVLGSGGLKLKVLKAPARPS